MTNVKALIFAKQSKRLPGKHLMSICGESMLKRIYHTLENTGSFEQVIVFSKYTNLEIDDCTIMRDFSHGTLINSLLNAIEKFDEFFAVGGDLPMLNSDVIYSLLKGYRGIPVAAVDFDGTIEPLFAIYNRIIHDEMLEHSLHDSQIFNFIKRRFQLVTLNKDQSSRLFNVNTSKDLETVRKILNCKDE